MVDQVTVALIYLAAQLHRPLLLECSAGRGKTQLGYALAPVAGTEVEHLQCYQKVKEEKAIGKFDEPLQRIYVGFKTRCSAPDCAVLQAELHDERFFSARPLMRALRYLKLFVLLIDELDKVDQEFEAVLLEVLVSASRFSIPKLGTITKPKFCSCGHRCSSHISSWYGGFWTKALRGWSLEKPPSMSEMRDLAQ